VRKTVQVLILILTATFMPVQAFGMEIGAGVIVGDPTGISVKYFLDDFTAVDMVLAWSMKKKEYLRLHLDYLLHDFKVIGREFDLPLVFYYGGGVKAVIADEPVAGLRAVTGIIYILKKPIIDFFFEIAPGINLIPETVFSMDAGLGARFYFQ